MNRAFERFEAVMEKAMALQAAMALFEWDNETLAPKEADEYTAKTIGSLSEQYREMMVSEEMRGAAAACRREGGLSGTEEAMLKEVKEEMERLSCIPAGEYREFAKLRAVATGVWAKAKEEQDFQKFAPMLETIVEYQKRFASYQAKEGQKLYDVMLDSYEKDFSMEALDAFFGELREALVPLQRKAQKACADVDDSFLSADYPLHAQEEAARFLAEYVGFDFNRGVMTVSAHPFTTNLHNHDVRITTHYRKRIDSSIFSVIHETGHALYELGIRDDLTQTVLGQGSSMGMHECQSRFFENIIGRSRAFWEPIYGRVTEIFGEPLKSVALDDFLAAVNRTAPGLIRTEADELSYSLHVLIRYEIEKMLIEDDVPVTDLPEIWNRKYEEYLGVRPGNDAEGALQDIHWSQGSFGYFPSYALGSAFGAQIYFHMKKEMDLDRLLREGRLDVIRAYLRERIHQYGKLKTSRELLREITGEDFSPKYYIQYLKDKYGR